MRWDQRRAHGRCLRSDEEQQMEEHEMAAVYTMQAYRSEVEDRPDKDDQRKLIMRKHLILLSLVRSTSCYYYSP